MDIAHCLEVAASLRGGLAVPTYLLSCLREGEATRTLALEHLTEWLSPDPSSPLAQLSADGEIWPGKQVVDEVSALVPQDHEQALLLARLHLAFCHRYGVQTSPDWRAWKFEDGLPAQVMLAWRRTELLANPEQLASCEVDELLLQAVSGVDLGDALSPERLVAQLLQHGDHRLVRTGLSLVEHGLLAGILVPAWAHEQVLALLGKVEQPALLAQAYTLLAQPWAQVVQPELALPKLGTGDADEQPVVAMARLQLAGVYRHAGILCACIENSDRPLPQRQVAIAFLAAFCGREHLDRILPLGAEDPMLFGGEAMSFTRVLHRRGLFVGPQHLAFLVPIYQGNYRVMAAEVAALTFTVRRAFVSLLCEWWTQTAPDPRTLELAVEIARIGEEELGRDLSLALTDVLAREPEPEVVRAILRTLALLGSSEAEPAVLDQLFAHPGDALDCLRAVGGEQTIACMTGLLALESDVHAPAMADPRIIPWRRKALLLLWGLAATDAPLRGRLVARLDPSAIPREIAAGLACFHHSEEWALLELSRRLGVWDRLSYLRAVAERGVDADGRSSWETMAGLLRGVVADVATGELVNTARRGEEQQTVPEQALAALRVFGERLFETGRLRPICLIRATSTRDAGVRMERWLALHVMRTATLHVQELQMVLRLLLDHARAHTSLGAALRGPELLGLLRHDSPDIRKLAIALIRETRGEDLSINLIRALDHNDIQTIRQALDALGSLAAKWASVAIAQKLDHPNMNVKKSAALALASAGTPAAVPKLLYWLGQHDNSGFRQHLTEALKSILGRGFTAVCLAALQVARAAVGPNGRRAELLAQVETDVSARAWRKLVPESRPQPGEQHPDMPATRQQSPVEQAIAFLAHTGWSRASAEVVLTAICDGYTLTSSDRTHLQSRFRNWVELSRDSALRGPALAVACELVGDGGWRGDQLGVWEHHLAVVLEHLPIAGATLGQGLLGVLDALRPRLSAQVCRVVVTCLRACNLPSTQGCTHIARLRAFGAKLCRSDLERALQIAGQAGNPWQVQKLLLQQTFGVNRRRHRLGEEASQRLEGAIRAEQTGTVTTLRATWNEGSRPTLATLCEVYPQAAAQHRLELLSWMVSLQPLNTPAWTLGEAPGEAKRRGTGTLDVLDMPRSSAVQAEFVEMLSRDPDLGRRRRAAELLLLWPELPCHVEVLEAWLGGHLKMPPQLQLRLAWPAMAKQRRRRWCATAIDQPDVAERLVELLTRVEPKYLEDDLGDLVALWAHQTGDALRLKIEGIVRRADVDKLVYTISPRLEAGELGCLRLLGGRVEATPLLLRLREQVTDDVTQASLFDTIELQSSPIRTAAAQTNRERLQALREQRPTVAEPEVPERADLVAHAKSLNVAVDVQAARRALSALARLGRDDREIVEILVHAVREGHPRVRVHAHRLLRTAAPRDVYLETTRCLLSDRRAEVRRSAARTLGFGRHLPAAGELVGLLGDHSPRVRESAREALQHLGRPALKVLHRARSKVRPNLRERVDAVIQAIEQAADLPS